MSSHSLDADEVDLETHSHSSTDSHSDYEPEHGDDHDIDTNEGDEQTESTDSWPPGPPSNDCPSTILARWARGAYDPKSPLRQFAMRIENPSQSGGTRKWKCNICKTEWFGSITRVNAHFLFWTGKGVGPCKFLEDPKNLHYRIEFNKLWGVSNELGITMPTTLSGRQQIQNIQQAHEQRIQGQPHIHTPKSHQRATSLGGSASGPSSTYSAIPGPQPSKGKRKVTLESNPIADLFNAQMKEEIEDAIGRHFFANGIPLHVARSPYYKEMMQLVARGGGPSFVPPGEHKLRTTILDKEYAKISTAMESMRVVWEESGCSIIMDGWTDIRNRPLINIIVICTEGPFFLREIDCSGHRKDADFQFDILRAAIEEIGPQNVVQVVTDAASMCKATGGLIEAAYRHIWWTPCCVHAMNNALKDMGKIN